MSLTPLSIEQELFAMFQTSFYDDPVDAVFNSIKRSSMVNTEISPLKVLNLTLLSTKRMWWTNDKF